MTETFGPPWTVLKLLEWSKQYFAERGIDSPRLDAELLLSHVLGMDRVRLYMQYDRPLVPDELEAYRALVKRRAGHEPVAYITGTRGFWSLDLKVDRRALIPRPETEVLVEEVLKHIPEDSPATFVDVGTGTGAIALAVASERPNLRVIATDASAEALALARENAERAGLADRVEFLEGDLLAAVPAQLTIDHVASNPPYVAETERDRLDPEVRDWEPAAALFAGPDGLDVIRRLAEQAAHRLTPGGWLTVEIGWDQGRTAPEVLARAGLADVVVRKDYSQNDRVVSGKRSAS